MATVHAAPDAGRTPRPRRRILSPPPLSTLPLADPGIPDLRSPSRFLLRTGRQQRRILTSLMAWGILWMGAQAAVPAALGAGVQAAADRDAAGSARWAAIVLVLGVAQACAGIMRHRKAVDNWITAASRTQQLVTRQAVHLGADLQRQVATGEVVAVTSSDVEKIGSVVDVLGRFAGAIVAFTGVGIVLVLSSPMLGIVVLVGVPLFTLGVAPLLRPLEARERAQRERLGRATELASDTVAGLRVLRGIGGEDLFLDRFREASQEVRTAAVRTARIRSLLDALEVALPGAFLVLITWLGARLVLDGVLQIGELVAFYGYAAFLVLPLRTVTEFAYKLTRARVAARRIVTILSLQRSRPDPDDPTVRDPSPAVTDALTGLEIAEGRFVAVASDDPDASDALAIRLGGLDTSDATAVRLDGIPLADLSRDVLRATILVQDKDPVILSGTLRDAVAAPRGRFGDDVRDDAGLAAALAVASADDVVDAVRWADPEAPSVWDARITERGRSLSGGQRQRLALARSIAADPPILVLDEPTSAVDAHTEARIADNLVVERRGRTTVVMTTSPLMLDRADEVVLLVAGTVAARGRHRHLLDTDPRYRDLVLRGVS